MPAFSAESNINSKPSLKNLTNKGFSIPEDDFFDEFRDLVKPHVKSFDWFITEGVKLIPNELDPIEVKSEETNDILRIECCDLTVKKPTSNESVGNYMETKAFPAESRQQARTYTGEIIIKFKVFVNDIEKGVISKNLGGMPIMVCSIGCNLHGFTPKQLIQHKRRRK